MVHLPAGTSIPINKTTKNLNIEIISGYRDNQFLDQAYRCFSYLQFSIAETNKKINIINNSECDRKYEEVNNTSKIIDSSRSFLFINQLCLTKLPKNDEFKSAHVFELNRTSNQTSSL